MTPGRSEDIKVEMLDSPKGNRLIKLTGPLVLRSLFDFQETARKETEKPIILDISDVPYMDSAGLGAVISIFASCQRTNRGFAIVGLSQRIKTLFEVTHCDGPLPCLATIDGAESEVSK